MSQEQSVPKVTKAFVFETAEGIRIRKAEADSQQLPDDPFNYRPDANSAGLVRPTMNMDMFAALLGGPESMGNTLHSRCCKQKASDVIGRGVELRAVEDEAENEGGAAGTKAEQNRWDEWVEGVEQDEQAEGSLKELLTWMWQDYESIGWGILESGRKTTGEPDGMWHVPSHTVRAHSDHIRFAQTRGDKLTWFKRFGVDGDVNKTNGDWVPGGLPPDVRGNELIVFRNYTPLSSYYGLPDMVPALGAFAGWSAQQQFNVRYFDNQAVPSMAVVIEGAELSEEVEATIYDHFERIKGDPARTIVIPIPGIPGIAEQFQPRLRFEKLSNDVKDASFRMYRQDIALETCISHGVPPYRIGWPIVGSLGGSTAEEMTAIYNDSIVQPRQETMEQRFRRTINGPKGLDITSFVMKVNELDVRNEMRDLEKAEKLYSLGAATPNDAIRFFGYEERDDEGGDYYITNPMNPQGGAGEPEEPEPPAANPFGGPPQGAQFGAAPMVDEAVAKYWRDELAEVTRLQERVRKALGDDLEDLYDDPVKSLAMTSE